MPTSKHLRIKQLKRSNCHVDSCYYRQKDQLFTIFAHSNYLSIWTIQHTNNDSSLEDNDDEESDEEDDDDIDIGVPLLKSSSKDSNNLETTNVIPNTNNDSHFLEASCLTEYLPLGFENTRITSINTFERYNEPLQ